MEGYKSPVWLQDLEAVWHTHRPRFLLSLPPAVHAGSVEGPLPRAPSVVRPPATSTMQHASCVDYTALCMFATSLDIDSEQFPALPPAPKWCSSLTHFCALPVLIQGARFALPRVECNPWFLIDYLVDNRIAQFHHFWVTVCLIIGLCKHT